MKREKFKFPNIFHSLFNWCILIFSIVLLICYIPKIRLYYNEIPQLKIDITDDNPDELIELPDAFEEEMVVCFWTNHRDVTVYLEEQEIYSTDIEGRVLFGGLAPSRWNRITIPGGSAGKELRIHSDVEYQWISREYVYGTDEQINQWLHQRYGFIQLIDAGIVGIGVLFVLFGGFSRRKTGVSELPLYLGQVMILMGLLLRVGFKGIPIHWMNEYGKDLIGYLTFFTATIPMYIYFSKKEYTTKLFEKTCYTVAVVQLIIVTIVFLLHGLNIVDVSDTLWLGAAFWGIFTFLILIRSIVLFVRKRNLTTTLTLFSTVSWTLMVPLEVIRILFLKDYIRTYGILSRACFVVIIALEVLTYAYSIQIMEVQKERTEEENKKLQFQLLSTQIRPHFILNTLGAIRAMVMEDAKKASDLLYDFSMFLRKNIEEKDYMKSIPFGEELDYIETYLRLEQTRFGERLKVEYHILEREFWVLPLSIQPFVENAVKHGLFPKKIGGTLKISTYKSEGNIVLEIMDDGMGFDAENLQTILSEKKSVGLRSAIYRIESEMRGKCSITSRENGETGTLVKVILPQ